VSIAEESLQIPVRESSARRLGPPVQPSEEVAQVDRLGVQVGRRYVYQVGQIVVDQRCDRWA
jgi:ribosomal protein L27